MTNKVLNLDFSKDPLLPPIIYGRVGDDRLQTVTVNITKRDEIADLSDGTISFEGVTNGGQTKVFDSDNVSTTAEGLKKGTFVYTFPNAAFAVEGKYERAYFSFVRDGKRDTTSSFEIIVFGNADIDAEEAETIITEYNKLIEQLHELYQQTSDKVTGEYDQFHQQITKTINDMETLIQNANADLAALKIKVDEIKQIIETLDNLSVIYSNSVDFGNYDYSGNPNLLPMYNFSNTHNNLSTNSTLTDGGTYIKVEKAQNTQPASVTFGFKDSKYSTPMLKENTQYTLTVRIKAESGFIGTGKDVTFRYRYQNDQNATVVPVGASLPNDDFMNGWTDYTFTGITTDTIKSADPYVHLWIEASAQGTLLIDYQIKLEKGAKSTPYQPNLLDDPYWLGKAPLGENIADPTKTFPIKTSSYNIYRGKNVEKYQVNQTYTITMKATKPVSQQFGVYLLAGAMGVGNMKPVEGLTDVWQLTFKVTQAHIDGGITDVLDVYQIPESTVGECQIDWLKIEKGDTRTPNIEQYKYRGIGMRDSTNPREYVWDLAPEYVEDNLATDVKISEITGKANDYTNSKVSQVNSSLLTVINVLEKRVSTNGNNILDNTTKIGELTTQIEKEYPYEADFYMGTNHNDAHYKTKSRMGWGAETNTIAERLGVNMKPCPLDFNEGRWNATFNRDCRVKLDVLVKVNGQGASSGHYCYIAYWKDVDQTVQWVEAQGIGQNADIMNRNIIPMTGIFNAKKGDCISVALELAEDKTVQMQLLNAHFQELS